MLNSRTFNFILILIGGIIAIYSKAEEQQSVYFLIVGIVILMFGLYRMSSGIPEKNDDSQEFSNKDEDE